ncbi:unnamed protein product [Eruca vesicaria subsp. sativa]|uniref:Disease resistance R13L4/SHOC-2-like LRR domain-containing protein n=1 Tax=Eruca vesicaria subsp. sativa TaxID=29727 RepID=A0ABC8JKX7_ERUVS|nr:unnamed protein product [Eruca vesicaria subsp. sativa]
MASKNNWQADQAGNTPEDNVDKILETLPELNKLLSDISGKSEEQQGITNQISTVARSLSAPSVLTHNSSDGKLIMRLQYHFRLLKLKLGKLEQFRTNLEAELDKHLATLQALVTDLDSSRVSSQPWHWIKRDLQGIEKKISDLLYQLPLLSGKSENQKATAYGDQDEGDEVHQEKAYTYLPGLHTNVEVLIRCETFRQVKQKFIDLDIERKMCLLSFAVFPENREVHRTVLMYWWIGEGILPVQGAEEAVRDILNEFTEKALVEPVEERRKVAPSSYKMNPFVHSSVIHLAKKVGIFDIYSGKYNKPITSKSEMGKVCIVEGSAEAALGENPLKIETVFNVSERDLDSTVKWFSKNPRAYRRFTINSSEAGFKSLNVFYLGRWERSKKRHIQVQNHELMKCLKHLTKVKVLSFQGISTIRSLDRSVCKLQHLIVLDLRECYELTKLPEKIDSLQNLVYLDMTGSYMLEYIPLRLALLKKLEVLKGFVVCDSLYESVACKLIYLKNLPKLRKLSIEINSDDLSVQDLTRYLVELKALTSLKVTWRRELDFVRDPPTGGAVKEFLRTMTMTPKFRAPAPFVFPSQLKKLNLQRFPDRVLPSWLQPKKLLHLKKLHIGGGRILKGFGDLPEEATECAVEVLRLTSLPQLRVGWIELKQLYFPNLTFLENYECPRVTLTPCDGSGIWKSDQD